MPSSSRKHLAPVAVLLLFICPYIHAQDKDPDTMTIRGEQFQLIPPEMVRSWGLIYNQIPAEKNAVTHYLKAIELWNDEPFADEQYELLTKYGITEGIDALVTFFKNNQPAVEELKKAAALSDYQFPFLHNGNRQPIPASMSPIQLHSWRRFSYLLADKARYQALTGDLDGAVDSCLLIFKCNRHWKTDPGLIGVLVATAIQNIAVDNLREITLRYDLGQERLQRIRMELDECCKNEIDMAYIFTVEKHISAILIKMVIEGTFSLGAGAGQPKIAGLPKIGGDWPYLRSLLGPRGMVVVMPDRAIAGHFAAYYDKPITSFGKRPLHELNDRKPDPFIEEIPRWDTLAATFLPAMTHYEESFAKSRLQLDLLDLAVALRLYQAKNNAFPETLAALVPDYIKQVPSDPYSPQGKPLVYEQMEKGFLLYSIGNDEKDGGGQIDFPSYADTDHSDIGYEYPVVPFPPRPEME